MLEVEGQPSGLGWMPDGSLLVVSMRDHTLLRRTPDGEVTVHADLTEHCGGHLNDLVVDELGRAYAGQLRLRPDELRRPGGHEPGPRRPRRLGQRRGRRPLVPERHGRRRRHADRGRDLRRAADGVLDRRRRLAHRPPRLGPDRADRRARRRWRRCSRTWASRPTAAAWTPRATSGSPTASAGRPCRIAPGGEIVEEIELPEGLRRVCLHARRGGWARAAAVLSTRLHRGQPQGRARGRAASPRPSTSPTEAAHDHAREGRSP